MKQGAQEQYIYENLNIVNFNHCRFTNVLWGNEKSTGNDMTIFWPMRVQALNANVEVCCDPRREGLSRENLCSFAVPPLPPLKEQTTVVYDTVHSRTLVGCVFNAPFMKEMCASACWCSHVVDVYSSIRGMSKPGMQIFGLERGISGRPRRSTLFACVLPDRGEVPQWWQRNPRRGIGTRVDREVNC